MTDKDILISDLNDISEILNNNGYGGWCMAIRKAVAMLKEQDEHLHELQQIVNDGYEAIKIATARIKKLESLLKKKEAMIKDIEEEASNWEFSAKA